MQQDLHIRNVDVGAILDFRIICRLTNTAQADMIGQAIRNHVAILRSASPELKRAMDDLALIEMGHTPNRGRET